MNCGDKRLSEYSLEELQEEIRKRQRTTEESTTTNFSVAVMDRLLASPIHLEAAHQILLSMIAVAEERRNGNPRLEFPMDQAMALLQQHPQLVTQPFHRRTLSSYFLEAGADREVMKTLCDMYKKYPLPAKWHKSSWQHYYDRKPNFISDACIYGAQNGVMDLLIEQFPHQLAEKSNDKNTGNIPVRYLLRPWMGQDVTQPVPGFLEVTETIEAMLEACPKMLESDWGGAYNLTQAVQGSFGDLLSPFLAKKYAESSAIQSLHMSGESWELKNVLSLNYILPKLTQFRLRPTQMNINAYPQTLSSLQCLKPSLKLLEFPVLPQFLRQPNGKQLILQALKSCNHLENITLFTLDNIDENPNHDEFINVCKDIIAMNTTIQSLCLDSFCLPDHNSLTGLLSQMVSIKALKCLDRVKVLNDGPFDAQLPPNCSLERLVVGGVGVDWTKGLLKQAKYMPFLSELNIDIGGDSNLTDEIIALLDQKRLRSLVFAREMTLDIGALAGALARDTNLRRLSLSAACDKDPKKILHLLQHHNATLESVTIHEQKCGATKKMIKHYTYLNRLGRAKLRGPNPSLAVLIECLCAIRNNTWTEYNLEYGLLREVPMLWSSGPEASN